VPLHFERESGEARGHIRGPKVNEKLSKPRLGLAYYAQIELIIDEINGNVTLRQTPLLCRNVLHCNAAL